MQSIFKPVKSNLLKAGAKFSSKKYDFAKNDIFYEHQVEKDGRIVRASFKRMNMPDKSHLKNQTCVLPISVGKNKEQHYGARIAATFSLVNRAFERCTIIIGDTLQAYSLRIHKPDELFENLLKESIEYGKYWISENKHLINNMLIPTQKIHWGTFMKHEKYQTYLDETINYYYTNEEFKKACHDNIEFFLSKNPGYVIEKEKAMQYGLEYLFCEFAVMRLWAEPEYAFNWDIYPMPRKTGMSIIYRDFIEPVTPDLIKSATLKFTHGKIEPDNINSYNSNGVDFYEEILTLPKSINAF